MCNSFLGAKASPVRGACQIAHNFVAYIIYYFSQKEKRITKNLHPGLLFGHIYDII